MKTLKDTRKYHSCKNSPVRKGERGRTLGVKHLEKAGRRLEVGTEEPRLEIERGASVSPSSDLPYPHSDPKPRAPRLPVLSKPLFSSAPASPTISAFRKPHSDQNFLTATHKRAFSNLNVVVKEKRQSSDARLRAEFESEKADYEKGFYGVLRFGYIAKCIRRISLKHIL
jgi:hypothetical protein